MGWLQFKRGNFGGTLLILVPVNLGFIVESEVIARVAVNRAILRRLPKRRGSDGTLSSWLG